MLTIYISYSLRERNVINLDTSLNGKFFGDRDK